MPVFPELIPDEITSFDQLSAYAGEVVNLRTPSTSDDIYTQTMGLFEDPDSYTDSGLRIAFASTNDGTDSELYLYRFGQYQYANTEPERIDVTITTVEPDVELNETDPFISPDGSLLVFTGVHPDGADVGGSSVYALDIRSTTAQLDTPVLVATFDSLTAICYEPTATNVHIPSEQFMVAFSANCSASYSDPSGDKNYIYQVPGDLGEVNYGLDSGTYTSILVQQNLTSFRSPLLLPDPVAIGYPAFLALAWNTGHDEVTFVSASSGLWNFLDFHFDGSGLIDFYDSKPAITGTLGGSGGYRYSVFRNGLDVSGDIHLFKLDIGYNDVMTITYNANISTLNFGLSGAYEDNPSISYDGKIIVFESYKQNSSDIYLGYNFTTGFERIARLTFDGGYTSPKATKLIDYELTQ